MACLAAPFSMIRLLIGYDQIRTIRGSESQSVSNQREGLDTSCSPKLKRHRPGVPVEGEKIPFKWGGKSEREGFDSSGFAAYVLRAPGYLRTPKGIGPVFSVRRSPATSPRAGDLLSTIAAS